MFKLKYLVNVVGKPDAKLSKSLSILFKNQKQLVLNQTEKLRFYCAKNENDKELFQDDHLKPTNNRNLKRKVVLSEGVKLYPGFQDSIEDAENAHHNIQQNEIDAKSLIEEFYGLNELEYETEDDQDIRKDNLITSELKRDEVKNAVLDVESCVKLLKRENIDDICCIRIPDEINYANYMIIGTCKSAKHMRSSYFNFNKAYKHAKTSDDQFALSSGHNSTKWCAIDMGNIILHLFTPEYRPYYDLESLWTTGAQFDDQYNDFIRNKSQMEQKLDFIEIKKNDAL